MMEEKILVSVIVLSYNSENTITDTLDSIYNQTYQEIELIISDDCSKDATKDVVESWLENHNGRFVSVKTNFKERNAGVAINGDEGVRLSTGTWIKCIAADDKLIESCIEKNLKYVYENNSQIVFSNMHYVRKGETVTKEEDCLRNKLKLFSHLDVSEQYQKLLIENPLPAPTAFFSRKLYDSVGGFDRDICMLEDWPFWIRVTKSGVRIAYNDLYTVVYRMSDNSVSHNDNFWKEAKKVKEKYCYPNIPKKKFLYFYHENWHNMMWLCRNKVKDSRIKCILVSLIFGVFWPPYLVKYVKSIIRSLI